MGVANKSGVTFSGDGSGPASMNSGTGDTMGTDFAVAVDVTLDWNTTNDYNIFTAAGDSADFTMTFDGGLGLLKLKLGNSTLANEDDNVDILIPAEVDRIQIWWEGGEVDGDVVHNVYYRYPNASQDLDLDDTTGRVDAGTITVSTATLSGFATRDIWFGGIIGSSPHAPVNPLGTDVTLWQVIFNFDSNEHLRYDGEAPAALPADWEVRDSAQVVIADTTLTAATDSFLPSAGDYAGKDGLGALNARIVSDQGGSELDMDITDALVAITGQSGGSPKAVLIAAGATDGLSLIGMLNELSGQTALTVNDALRKFAETYDPSA